MKAHHATDPPPHFGPTPFRIMHESDKTLTSKHVGANDLKSNAVKICFGGDARCKQVVNMLKKLHKAGVQVNHALG